MIAAPFGFLVMADLLVAVFVCCSGLMIWGVPKQ